MLQKMKTYTGYIRKSPYHIGKVLIDQNKIEGTCVDYGSFHESPLVADLLFSIDTLTKLIRKSTVERAKMRYIDIQLQMQGDLNYYLRCPRQRYLDDLLYQDREEKRWIRVENKRNVICYCESDLESLTVDTADEFVFILGILDRDFMADIREVSKETINELAGNGYIVLITSQKFMVNPWLLDGNEVRRKNAIQIFDKIVCKNALDRLEILMNIRIYGVKALPEFQENDKDYYNLDGLIMNE